MQKALAVVFILSALLSTFVVAYPQNQQQHPCGPPPNGPRPSGPPPSGMPMRAGGPCGPPPNGQRPSTTAATTSTG